MKNLAIARRYAKSPAINRKGRTATRRPTVTELEGVAQMVAANKQLEQVITNPLYDKERRRNIWSALVDKMKLSKVTTSFLMLLFDKGRIGFLKDINEFYRKLADELKGVARASVTSASELSADTVDKIREALSQKDGQGNPAGGRTGPHPHRRYRHAPGGPCFGRKHKNAAIKYERIFKKG